ncbi:hypothetical protein D3C73_1621950 [compost metagenome]
MTPEASRPGALAGSIENRLTMLMPTISWSAGVLACTAAIGLSAMITPSRLVRRVGNTVFMWASFFL